MLSRLVLVLALVGANGSVSLVGVYPNPATHGDAGEYVLLDSDSETSLETYTLSDGERTIDLPAETIRGTVAVTDDPQIARDIANETTVVVPQGLSLSNTGENITLRRSGTEVSNLSYEGPPTAEVWNGDEWTPLGATDVPVHTERSVPSTAFALPDTHDVVRERIETANRRILLAGYTFTSGSIADALIDAHRRGVDVTVLIDGSPVGGTPKRQLQTLDRLSEAGIDVVVSGGQRARYRYHHAKYAVVDQSAVVMTENWKPSGVGGKASRGWGVILDDPTVADHLATVYAADVEGFDAHDWTNRSPEGQPVSPADGEFPPRFEPAVSNASTARVIVAPDNADAAVESLLAEANDSILIQQVSIEEDGPLLAAALAAAERGVTVNILLGSEWYVEAENRDLQSKLERIARERSLPLSVRLAEPRSRYDHVHAKGVIVDERHTVVGSFNWNRNAFENNREVGVILTDESIARYYSRLFMADWRGAAWRIHWGTVAATATAVLGATVLLSRFEFDPVD